MEKRQSLSVQPPSPTAAQATPRVCAAKADVGNTAATATTAGNNALSDNEPRHRQSLTSPKFGHDRAAHCAEEPKVVSDIRLLHSGTKAEQPHVPAVGIAWLRMR